MLTDKLVQAPSVQQFLNILLEDLSARRNHLVLLPAGVEALDLWRAMERRLVHREFHIEEVSLPILPSDALPAVALGKALNVQWPQASSPRSVANLMISEGLPEIIHLAGFDELSESARAIWLAFLLEWTEVSKNLFDRNLTPPTLSLFTPGSVFLPRQVPESALHLSVQYWWGLPSALEVQMLCRSESARGERSPLHRWREHLIPAVIGNDLPLAEHLWDHLHLDCNQLLPLLRAFGEQRGWTSQLLQTWGVEDFLLTPTSNDTRPSPIPSHWYQLWTHGALNWTPEYGLELHPAALALLGRAEDLQHRLWRGQTSLLLPLIDKVRLTICRHLSQRYGENWPVRWRQPDVAEEAAAVRDNPFACQWGHLSQLLKNCGSLRQERHLLPVVDLTRWVRNQLAHYRPIKLRDFEGLWREIYQL